MLEDVEMPPGQDFGVVVAKGQPGVFGAAHGLPELGRLPNLQKDRPAFPLEAALDHFPVQSQTQQFMKQFFRRHARGLPSIPPKTAENQKDFRQAERTFPRHHGPQAGRTKAQRLAQGLG